MSDVTDFLKQLPISFVVFFVAIGALYIGLMVYFVQRGRQRRLRKQQAMMGGTMPQAETQPAPQLPNFLSKLLNFSGPAKPEPAADWTIPPELRRLPEPDLDFLSGSRAPENREPSPVRVVPERGSTESASAAMIADMARATPHQSTDYGQMAVEAGSEMENMANMGNVELPADAIEVLRVYRDLSDGKLIVQLGDQQYRGLSDIQNADLARRFMAIVRELGAMINTGSAGRAVPPNLAGDQKTRMGLMTGNQEPEQKPSMLRNIAKAASGKSDIPESPTGIANAVEEFLQFKLSSTPQFATRTIHIKPAPDHSIRIEVDGHSYEGIGDVADPEVRDFLYAMMREWEARH